MGSEGLVWVSSRVQFCHVKTEIALRHQKAADFPGKENTKEDGILGYPNYVSRSRKLRSEN